MKLRDRSVLIIGISGFAGVEAGQAPRGRGGEGLRNSEEKGLWDLTPQPQKRVYWLPDEDHLGGPTYPIFGYQQIIGPRV